ncbi:MAG: hypothetical protein IPP29_21230 [Bacteroidetes bacterium]|nr:hypothetical protein [Bacteroidota bacterium]
MQFGSQLANLSNTGYGTAIPAAGLPNNHYYGFNIDQDWRTVGIIRTWVNGITPNRTFVIDCNGGQFFSATGNVSYQLHIKENGSLETHITATSGSANAGAIGVENSTGTVAFAAPGRNTVAASSIVPPESWRFAPIAPPTYTYAWSPATGLSSTSVANPVSTPRARNYYIYCSGNRIWGRLYCFRYYIHYQFRCR